jgi:hypothetical protein
MLIILAIFSIFFGYITKDIYLGLGSAFFADNSIFIHPSHEIMIETDFAVPTIFKLLPFISTIFFSGLALVLSEFYPNLLMSFKFTRFGYNLFGFFNQRFLVELFYNKYITGTILALGGQTTKIIDKGSIELIGPFGLEKGLLNLSKNIANMDSGVITSYALYILVGLIFYILILTLGTAGILDGFFSFTDAALSMFPILVYPNARKLQKTIMTNVNGKFGIYRWINLNPPYNSTTGLIKHVSPVKYYSNADEHKSKICADNKKKSGIYRWTNLKSGKTYVGSGVDLGRRFHQYFSLYYLVAKDSMYICRSLRKHGERAP